MNARYLSLVVFLGSKQIKWFIPHIDNKKAVEIIHMLVYNSWPIKNETFIILRFMNIIFFLLLGLGSIFSAYSSSDTSDAIQNYNFEIIGKFSVKNKRHIGQAGLLLPIYSKHNMLLYIPAFVMRDSKHSNETNLGIGFRRLFVNKYIHGAYAFFDYRKSPQNIFFKQITLGYEFFKDSFELRTNLYLPENKSIKNYTPIKDEVKSHYNGQITTFDIAHINNLYVEKASHGFDLEVGLTKGDSVSFYLAYYGFLNQKDQTHGLRARGNLHVLSFLLLEAEISYGTSGQVTPYVGFKLKIPFRKRRHQKSLYSKMTYLPVRDIDIRSSIKLFKNVPISEYRVVKGWVPFINKQSETSSNQNVYNSMAQLTGELASGKKYTDIATISSYNQLFTLMGNFDGREQLLIPGTVEYDILTNISDKYTSADSALNNVLTKGFWTNQIELIDNLTALNELNDHDRAKHHKATADTIKEAIEKGVSPFVLDLALKWEFRNRADVFVAEFGGIIGPHSETGKTEDENIAELAKALAHKDYTTKTRYIAMNFHQKRHAVGVVIDLADRKIIYMDPNNLDHTFPWEGSTFDYATGKFVGYNKPVLDTQFPGFTYVNYTPVIQEEDWSCSVHTFMNITGYLKNHFTIDQSKYNRHVSSVYERMYNAHWAYFLDYEYNP